MQRQEIIDRFIDKNTLALSSPEAAARFIQSAFKNYDPNKASLIIDAVLKISTDDNRQKYLDRIWEEVRIAVNESLQNTNELNLETYYSSPIKIGGHVYREQLLLLFEIVKKLNPIQKSKNSQAQQQYDELFLLITNKLFCFMDIYKHSFQTYTGPFEAKLEVMFDALAFGYTLPKNYYSHFTALFSTYLQATNTPSEVKDKAVAIINLINIIFRIDDHHQDTAVINHGKSKLFKIISNVLLDLIDRNLCFDDLVLDIIFNHFPEDQLSAKNKLKVVQLAFRHPPIHYLKDSPFSLAKSADEILLLIYDYLSDNNRGLRFLNKGWVIKTLLTLPSEITGINKNLPKELLDEIEHYIFNPNAADQNKINELKKIILPLLRRTIIQSSASTIPRVIHIKGNTGGEAQNVRIDLKTESELLQKWKGIYNYILQNIKLCDVNSELILNAIKEENTNANFINYIDLFAHLKKMRSIVSNELFDVLNLIISKMQNGFKPDENIWERTKSIFAYRNDFTDLADEFKKLNNDLSQEYLSWKSSEWAPLRSKKISEELTRFSKRFDDIAKLEKLVYSRKHSDPETLTKLRFLIAEVNKFSKEDKLLNSLRKEHAAHTSTDSADRILTYFYTLDNEDKSEEATFDHVRQFFFNALSALRPVSGSHEYNLLNKIKSANNTNQIYMSIYEYLSCLHSQAFMSNASSQMQESIMTMLLSLPESETNISKSHLPTKVANNSLLLRENILQQLSFKLGKLQHQVFLDNASISLSVEKEIELFIKWKGFALNIAKKVKTADYDLFTRMLGIPDIATIQSSIEETKTYSQLFTVLSHLKNLHKGNHHLQESLQIILTSMRSCKDPLEANATFILKSPTCDQLQNQLQTLKTEFDSWNGSLWSIVNNSFINSETTHARMGINVENKLAEFERLITKLAKKPTNANTLSEMAALNEQLRNFAEKNSDFNTLRQAKNDHDKSIMVETEKVQTNKEKATEIKTKIHAMSHQAFLTFEQIRSLQTCGNYAKSVIEGHNEDDAQTVLATLTIHQRKLDNIANEARANEFKLEEYIELFKVLITKIKAKKDNLTIDNQAELIEIEGDISLLRTQRKLDLDQIKSILDQLKFLQSITEMPKVPIDEVSLISGLTFFRTESVQKDLSEISPDITRKQILDC